jgi:hypothetical protein
MADTAPEQCSEPGIADLFPSYINGHASAEEKQRIEKHLRECQSCREDLQFFQDLKGVGKTVFCED